MLMLGTSKVKYSFVHLFLEVDVAWLDGLGCWAAATTGYVSFPVHGGESSLSNRVEKSSRNSSLSAINAFFISAADKSSSLRRISYFDRYPALQWPCPLSLVLHIGVVAVGGRG